MMHAPAVVIHGLAEAEAALARQRPVVLVSAPAAALGPGCLWWRELIAAARARHPHTPCADLLDCADAAGLAFGALRAGQRALRLDATCPGFTAVAAAALALGAEVVAERPPALDLATPQALWRLADWLGDSATALG